jgi:hypothetical protein
MIKRDEIDVPDSCWNKARDNERLFVLLARDAAASVAIRAWVTERLRLNKNTETDPQIVEALECARLMDVERREAEESHRQTEMRIAEHGTVAP